MHEVPDRHRGRPRVPPAPAQVNRHQHSSKAVLARQDEASAQDPEVQTQKVRDRRRGGLIIEIIEFKIVILLFGDAPRPGADRPLRTFQRPQPLAAGAQRGPQCGAGCRSGPRPGLGLAAVHQLYQGQAEKIMSSPDPAMMVSLSYIRAGHCRLR